MKIAVLTGATGFIGWHLAGRLRDDGWQVRAAVRPESTRELPPGVERYTARLDAEAMAEVCRGADIVYHLAALTRAPNDQAFRRVNEEGTRQAALATRTAGAMLVYVSTQAAGGPGTLDSPRTEADDPQPVSSYGRSKLAGEIAVRRIEGLRWTILRPTAVYGPRDTDFLLLFRLVRRGFFPVLGDPHRAYSLIYVADLVDALAGVHDQSDALGEVFFVSHPSAVSQAEIGCTMAAVLNRDHRELRIPEILLWLLCSIGEIGSLVGRPGLLNRSRYRELTAPGFVCSVDKACQLLGYVAHTSLAVGLEETAAWYRQQRLL